ncbi:type II secretion system protein [Bordetella bronchiseptica]|uniref:type II secretion system protein n=1 Tax=Bordetella bronchiseptica TaxID=518 RepID=UPI00081CFE12|nr:prepilin-type N-terminal cleavage/methylation domain-containing protein [Bordetella bronchiseptica]AOB25415.1 prepilin-type N-terminal cleavage/methylation domain-containing protein [Bordetella bronchiseptica]AZW42672.1 prepilin-type cleavage/methylation domain-containing protein [Bordetella bronchiseptica]
MTRRARLPAAGRQHGYTLLEVAIALAVVGLLGAGLYGAQQALYSHGSQGQAQAEAERARQAVLAYALRMQRLPCPDTAGNGWASHADGQCTQASGWLPYETLGLAGAAAPGANGRRLAYAALRVSGGPDLFRPSAGAAPVDYSPGGEAALYEALRRAGQMPYDGAALRLATARQGVADPCAGAGQVNPAFVVIAPATPATGGALPVFSAAHAALARGAALCAIAPAGGRANQNSDAVAAVGTAELLGWLTARAH